VYYDIGEIQQAFPTSYLLNRAAMDEQTVKIDAKINAAINAKLTALFESDLRFTPATVDGKQVISFVYPFKGKDRFAVKNHVATFNHN